MNIYRLQENTVHRAYRILKDAPGGKTQVVGIPYYDIEAAKKELAALRKDAALTDENSWRDVA